MRLQDSPKTKLQIPFAVALRAIGQDLAPLVIESLEIKFEEQTFTARGRCITYAAEAAPGSDGVMSKAWQSLTGRSAREQKAALESFTRQYSPENIRRLDELGASHQTGGGKIPDPSSLAESLRTIGRTVDSKNGRLVKLFKGERNVVFIYEDADGTHTEELYSLALYKSQQEALALRGKIKKPDIWDDSK